MKIEAKFTAGQVTKVIQQRVAAIENAAVEGLKFIGEKFVAAARSEGKYKDHTGNLRASIGYFITKDGRRIYSAFPGSGLGKSKGIEVAEKAARKHSKGYALIVVAGMHYAAAVESKNYNVLTAQSVQAADDVLKMVARLQNKFK